MPPTSQQDMKYPLHKDSASPLRVPYEAMTGLGQAFADLYGGCLESPPTFWFFSFLAFFGSLVSKVITLDSELHPQPRLYTVLLGPSADARKSTPLLKTRDFFSSLNAEGWDIGFSLGVGSAEGLLKDLDDAPAKKLLLLYDEFRSFVDKARIRNAILLPVVTTLFEGNDYHTRTNERTVRVDGAHLSLLAACTEDTYVSMFTQQFHSIGFLNRLWLVPDAPSRRIAVPSPIPERELDALKCRVRDRLAFLAKAFRENKDRPLEYRLTPEARARFEAWYNAHERSIFTKRLDTYAFRLMLLLAATADEHRFEIGADIVEHVLALLDYQLAARRRCDPIDADSTIARLEEKIRRELAGGPLKHTDLKRRCNYSYYGIWLWKHAIENLINAREIVDDAHERKYWLREHWEQREKPIQQAEPTREGIQKKPASEPAGGSSSPPSAPDKQASEQTPPQQSGLASREPSPAEVVEIVHRFLQVTGPITVRALTGGMAAKRIPVPVVQQALAILQRSGRVEDRSGYVIAY